MKNAKGKVFYIGKAKNLRNRLKSYFSGSDTRAFVLLLDRLLADIEVILTPTEQEALIVENDLIKEHRPKHNIKLVDDKRYLCLRLDTRKDYPRMEIRRSFKRDGARYFGPYSSATSIRQTLNILNRYFQLRTCTDHVLNNRSRPCLQYQIKRCPAPCVYDLSDGSYSKNVEATIAFLDGRHETLIEKLEQEMKEKAAALEYEDAARIRDQLKAIRRTLEKQDLINPDFMDRDIIGIYREGPAIEIHVLMSRGGRVFGAQRCSLDDSELPTQEVLTDFLSRYYQTTHNFPTEVLIPEDVDWAEEVGQLITQRAGRRVVLMHPKRGRKRRLIDMAHQNARQAFQDKVREQGAAQTAVDKLQRALHLRLPPIRMECFDISHFQGSEIVASCVSFQAGVPHKGGYRRYKIRSTTTQDDFQSMYEVISRRARRGLEKDDLPDLMVIDGGRGQLGAARAALDDHGINHLDLIALAKARQASSEVDKSSSPKIRAFERVFLEGRKNPVVLRPNSSELFMLTRARDEAHRFAVEYNRSARRKKAHSSILDEIPGIGPARKRKLLKSFGSIQRLEKASEKEIAKTVGPKIARLIHAKLHPQPKG
uniref:UvrABC system protein C n=1 Tax=uncultured myxobacterium HF0130_06F04 TaxID=723555 RepID=E7C2H1_9BACT|nr:nuclease subunit of the excinuclease complex [uncultured myxobacterium HF0130_06F04]